MGALTCGETELGGQRWPGRRVAAEHREGRQHVGRKCVTQMENAECGDTRPDVCAGQVARRSFVAHLPEHCCVRESEEDRRHTEVHTGSGLEVPPCFLGHRLHPAGHDTSSHAVMRITWGKVKKLDFQTPSLEIPI